MNKIKISGHKIQINITKRRDELGGDYALYYPNLSKIEICKDLDIQQKESTLLHEIIEAINFFNELNLPHQTISILESSLYQVLKDNFNIDFKIYYFMDQKKRIVKPKNSDKNDVII